MTPNPLLPGVNPHPSVVRVDGTYYLVASSFSPLGRETFLAPVRWVDGWPKADLVVPTGTADEDVVLDAALDGSSGGGSCT